MYNEKQIRPDQVAPNDVEYFDTFDADILRHSGVSKKKYIIMSEIANRMDQLEEVAPGESILTVQQWLNNLKSKKYCIIATIANLIVELEVEAPGESQMAVANYLRVISTDDKLRIATESLATRGEAPSQQKQAQNGSSSRQNVKQGVDKGLLKLKEMGLKIPIVGKDGTEIDLFKQIDEMRLAYASTTESKKYDEYKGLARISRAKYRMDVWKIDPNTGLPCLNNQHYLIDFEEDKDFIKFHSLELDNIDEKKPKKFPKKRRIKHNSCRVYSLYERDDKGDFLQVAGYTEDEQTKPKKTKTK